MFTKRPGLPPDRKSSYFRNANDQKKKSEPTPERTEEKTAEPVKQPSPFRP